MNNLTSPFHEICFPLRFLPPDRGSHGSLALGQQRSFHVIQELIELRSARRLDEPKVVRIYESDGGDEMDRQRAETIARQFRVDRFVYQTTVQ